MKSFSQFRFCALLLFIPVGPTWAQQEKLDSLTHLLSQASKAEDKFELSKELSRMYESRNPDSAIKYGEVMLHQARVLGNKDEHMAASYLMLGNAFKSHGSLNTSDSLYEKGLSHTEEQTMDSWRAKIWMSRGVLRKIQGDYEKALLAYDHSLSIAIHSGDSALIADNQINLGNLYRRLGRLQEAGFHLKRAVHIFQHLGDREKLAIALVNLGAVYEQTGNYNQALKNYYQCLPIFEEFENLIGLGATHLNLGNILLFQEHLDEAQSQYVKALAAFRKANNPVAVSYCYGAIAEVLIQKESFEKGLDYANEFVKRSLDGGEKQGVLESMMVKARCLIMLGRYAESEALLNEAEIQKQGLDEPKIEIDLGNIRSLHYARQGNLPLAKKYGEPALALARKLNYTELELGILENLYLAQKQSGNFGMALDFLEEIRVLEDSLKDRKKLKELADQQASFHFQQQWVLDSLHRDREHRELEIIRQDELKLNRTYAWSGVLGAFLFLGIAAILYRRNVEKQRSNKMLSEKNLQIREINAELEAQNEEISAQRDQLEAQNVLIGEKNQQITDSIAYAKNIQDAMLPEHSEVDQLFEDHFIFFKPRDVVSGDFFWIQSQQNHLFAAVVDCTGHGVPGAFMSMIGSELLNRIVVQEKVLEPGLILSRMDVLLRSSLKQNTNQNRDGMDAVLIRMDTKVDQVLFAGAKNPVAYQEGKEIRVIKGDKFPIGGDLMEGSRKFTTREIPVKKGNWIYLFSDGIQDQFGGEKRKKFFQKRLLENLASQMGQIGIGQRDHLQAVLTRWMENEEQVDDMCLLGIKRS